MADINCIGVYTSGGDAPGMNACIRAVTRRALVAGMDVVGIRRGYAGMIEGDFVSLKRQDVSNILQRGGTILKSGRSTAYRTTAGRARAAENLCEAGIDAVVAIGGDGTLHGASLLVREHGIIVAGCPGTIDNDLWGTDETIGFDSAINTALDSIDKIRDTADAHDRLFLVEVMGRDSAFIALACGIGGGAEHIVIPEELDDIESIKQRLSALMMETHRSSIVIVAEGPALNGANTIAQALSADERFRNLELRITVLGHVQRGGAPTARDRVLATRLGVAAVESLLEGETDVMVGVVDGALSRIPIADAWGRTKEIDRSVLELVRVVG